MIKVLFTAVVLLTSHLLLSQPDTDIFLMDISASEKGLEISNFKNISNNPGYDSQPSFALDALLYAGTENGQTEIKSYNIASGTTERINQPTSGGEYSPLLAPDGVGFTAVRLDTTGLQRLYYYKNTGESQQLIEDLQVAYYAFYDKNTLLASVLSDDRLDLVLVDYTQKKWDTIVLNSGRSIHKIPNTRAMSYTVLNEDGNYDIYQLDMETRESFFITELPIGIQDYAWLSESKLILGSTDKLFIYDLFGTGEWKPAADLSNYSFQNITRITVNAGGTKLALAAELKTE
ncbi:hypothetical protein ATE92_2057 [Ulvibacter sp. MAR_2010_11]|uniref:TolB family protein n=1 Tax=Ulvibacter sp. MAR_2010_11 TaxID=1250229 RepID=UPI000C2C4BFD|nr:hypothetical protein [Ulvibacter sp. MAR_2010_11]PKA83888.1 hypothetical protein ATE92_2057 [Ulvibacter sp. MAR_2010_11]